MMLLLLILPARSDFPLNAPRSTLVIVALVAAALRLLHALRRLPPHPASTPSSPRSQDATGSGRAGDLACGLGDVYRASGSRGSATARSWISLGGPRLATRRTRTSQGFNVHPEEVHNVYLGTATELRHHRSHAICRPAGSRPPWHYRLTARRARKLGEDLCGQLSSNALIVGLAGWAIGSLLHRERRRTAASGS